MWTCAHCGEPIEGGHIFATFREGSQLRDRRFHWKCFAAFKRTGEVIESWERGALPTVERRPT